MNSKAPIQISNKGFTLIELIVGMVITTIISGLALVMFTNSSTTFRNDKKNIETNQNFSAILDIIGNDIKQAGEQIADSNFPVVTISQVGGNANASTITVRRALDNTLPLCIAIPSGTSPASITKVIVADSTISGNCTPTINTTATPNLPTTLRAWRDLRCKVDNPNSSPTNGDYCDGNSSEVLRAAISDNNGHIFAFNYTGEAQNPSNTNQYQITAAGITNAPTYSYGVGSPVYLIEERTYALNITTGELTLSVNGGAAETLIKGIDKFKVSTRVYRDPIAKEIETSPSPSSDVCGASAPDNGYLCQFNDTQVNNWKTLAGVKVELQAKDPNGKASASLTTEEKLKLSSAAEFFPRNTLSRWTHPQLRYASLGASCLREACATAHFHCGEVSWLLPFGISPLA